MDDNGECILFGPLFGPANAGYRSLVLQSNKDSLLWYWLHLWPVSDSAVNEETGILCLLQPRGSV